MQSSKDATWTQGLSLKQAALVAGFTYLLNPVTFAEAYVMPRLVSADPAETVRNLTAHPHLFSAAVLSYVVSAIGDVVMAWGLYALLRPIHRALAMLGSLLQLVYAAAWLASIANLGLIYRFVAVPDYSRHTSATGLPAQIAELLGAYRSGWGLSLILFGLHLVVTGWLLARRTFRAGLAGCSSLTVGRGWSTAFPSISSRRRICNSSK